MNPYVYILIHQSGTNIEYVSSLFCVFLIRVTFHTCIVMQSNTCKSTYMHLFKCVWFDTQAKTYITHTLNKYVHETYMNTKNTQCQWSTYKIKCIKIKRVWFDTNTYVYEIFLTRMNSYTYEMLHVNLSNQMYCKSNANEMAVFDRFAGRSLFLRVSDSGIRWSVPVTYYFLTL